MERILITFSTTSSLDAALALTPSVRGPMKAAPQDLSLSTLAETAGFRYMDSCIAGTKATGTPEPKATVAMDVTAVSSIPLAIFETVLAVAGYISSRSADPMRSMCSVRPVRDRTGGWPLANSNESGVTSLDAASVITGNTSAPWRISSRTA